MISGEQPVNTPDVLQALKDARALIADETNWCQGKVFDGHKCCAYGALKKVTEGGRRNTLRWLAQIQLEALLTHGYTALSYFNDTHTHAEVLNLFDRAIARLEARWEGEQQHLKTSSNPGAPCNVAKDETPWHRVHPLNIIQRG
jgi:hypothetical protein